MAERPDDPHRPRSDALLETADEARGRFKIFLGAAPGVGKTYEMLTNAQARGADGVDVVIGVIETHGRRETEALVAGLERVPRRDIPYKGRILSEMDLDAILTRRPALVLVDELAHTNAPGSRHPKRYLDVEDILAAGIDVFSTLNVQHLESLNDVVAQITRVRVQETVPDQVLDRADEIEVIDITPGDLIQRLKEGKVYLPETAGRAVQNYFSPGNLTALRELALRRTAQRVDEQLLTHMQAHAIMGPWPAGERILVCVGPGPGGPALVRYARRMSERLRAPWTAITVETGRSARLAQAARDRIADHLRLAERLGAETTVLPGQTAAAEVLRYARAGNVTHIVVGRSSRSGPLARLFGSLAEELIRGAGSISVHVIAGREAEPSGDQASRSKLQGPGAALTPLALAGAGIAAAGATGIGILLRQAIGFHNVALVYLLGVLFVAVLFGLAPALLVSVASALAFNFFFLPPLYTFVIADAESVVALLVFLIVAVIASNLTAGIRNQALVAQRRAKITEDLYAFSRKLSAVGLLDDVLWAAAFQIASMLKVGVVLMLPEDGRIAVRAGYPPEDQLDEADLAAAQWSHENNRAAGRGADTLPGARRLFLPLHTGRGGVGAVGLDKDGSGTPFSPEERRLLDALLDQTALAIERVTLMASLDRARLVGETERLRTALLTSISHDLRTPLASIQGAAGTLSDLATLLTEAQKRELTDTIQNEAERLNRFIANLLDMTRLESGAIRPKTSPQDLSDLVGAALKRAEKILAGHPVELALPGDLPPLALDPVLFEQVLFNLLDNAAKYAPPASLVRIEAALEGAAVVLRVLDRGLGIPAGDEERVFDKFARIERGDAGPAGTGLGLAICRGFVEAMGGTIVARGRTDGPGACFLVRLPVPAGASLGLAEPVS